jgi:hypothetical protein
MAPRKNVVKVSKYPGIVSEKENGYLRGLSDYKAKVRRRESLRTSRCLKVSDISGRGVAMCWVVLVGMIVHYGIEVFSPKNI